MEAIRRRAIRLGQLWFVTIAMMFAWIVRDVPLHDWAFLWTAVCSVSFGCALNDAILNRRQEGGG